MRRHMGKKPCEIECQSLAFRYHESATVRRSSPWIGTSARTTRLPGAPTATIRSGMRCTTSRCSRCRIGCELEPNAHASTLPDHDSRDVESLAAYRHEVDVRHHNAASRNRRSGIVFNSEHRVGEFGRNRRSIEYALSEDYFVCPFGPRRGLPRASIRAPYRLDARLFPQGWQSRGVSSGPSMQTPGSRFP